MKKNKDPYPITDVYHVTDTLVDGATVVVTDLCDNLSNNIDTDTENILSDTKKNSKNLIPFQFQMEQMVHILFG